MIYCMQSVSTDKINQDDSVDTWLFLLLWTYFDFSIVFMVWLIVSETFLKMALFLLFYQPIFMVYFPISSGQEHFMSIRLTKKVRVICVLFQGKSGKLKTLQLYEPYDVVSLFANVPLKKIINIIIKYICNKNDIATSLPSVCLKS